MRTGVGDGPMAVAKVVDHPGEPCLYWCGSRSAECTIAPAELGQPRLVVAGAWARDHLAKHLDEWLGLARGVGVAWFCARRPCSGAVVCTQQPAEIFARGHLAPCGACACTSTLYGRGASFGRGHP